MTLQNEIDETLLSDKKGFEDLVICDEKDFTLAPIIISKKENDKKRNKKIIENLKAMLAIIQMRKEALINHHILNRKIFEKMGFKMILISISLHVKLIKKLKDCMTY